MAISRMQQPRQQYGLGKLVKKAFKGVKKIAKSPIGKAALIGGGLYGINKFGMPGLGGKGFLKGGGGGIWNAIRGGAGKIGGWLNPWAGGNFSGKKLFGLGAGAAIAAPFIQSALKWGPYEEEEEVEEDWTETPSSILNLRNQARDYYTAAQPDYTGSPFMPDKQFVMPNFYAADGGRAGLLGGGEAGQAQMEQMLRAEYLKYRNQGGTMPYEQFKMLVMKQAEQGQMPNQMMAANGGRAGYLLGGEVEQQTDFIQGPQGNEEFSETVVEEVGATDEQKAMVHDMLQRGMDHATIAEVTGLDEATVLSIIQEAQAMAQGGRAGFKWGGSEAIDIAPLETYNTDEVQDIEKELGVGPMADWDDVTPLELESLELLREEFRNDNNGQEPRSIQELMKFMFEKHGPSGVAEVEDALAEGREMAAQGGRIGAQEGGLMDLGGQEKDYRDEGGFVALGGEERADDVPARLSKNEFVFTADAVRNAGGGDIDRGSEVMQNMMDNLEAGGEISEESQGLEGGEEIMSEEIIDESNPAQEMYDNYEQLQSRVI